MTTYATDWRAAGACRSADPELFFPIATGVAVDDHPGHEGATDCTAAGSGRQCLDFAMQNGEVHGVWGGTTRKSGSGPGARWCAARGEPTGPCRKPGRPDAS